jgi:hypothetical protein
MKELRKEIRFIEVLAVGILWRTEDRRAAANFLVKMWIRLQILIQL